MNLIFFLLFPTWAPRDSYVLKTGWLVDPTCESHLLKWWIIYSHPSNLSFASTTSRGPGRTRKRPAVLQPATYFSPPHTLHGDPTLFPLLRSRVLWVPSEARFCSRKDWPCPRPWKSWVGTALSLSKLLNQKEWEVSSVKTNAWAINTNYKHLVPWSQRVTLDLLDLLFSSLLPFQIHGTVLWVEQVCLLLLWLSLLLDASVCACVCTCVRERVRVSSRVTGLCCHQPLFW